MRPMVAIRQTITPVAGSTSIDILRKEGEVQNGLVLTTVPSVFLRLGELTPTTPEMVTGTVNVDMEKKGGKTGG